MKKKERKMLLWAGLGVAAIWLFTRPKAAPPSKPQQNARAAAEKYTDRSVVSGIGRPYRDATV